MTKHLLILQSNYIPWRGYFDLIHAVDEFVVYDGVQFTKRDWRNRNQIILEGKKHWLSIPVNTKDKYFQKINQTRVVSPNWCQKHFDTLNHAYATSPFFKNYKDELAEIYFHTLPKLTYLSEINLTLLRMLMNWLGITTMIDTQTKAATGLTKTDALVDICQQKRATHYLSGPAAKTYIEEEKFAKSGVQLEYFDYPNYEMYPQNLSDFDSRVSVLDWVFNCGEAVKEYYKK